MKKLLVQGYACARLPVHSAQVAKQRSTDCSAQHSLCRNVVVSHGQPRLVAAVLLQKMPCIYCMAGVDVLTFIVLIVNQSIHQLTFPALMSPKGRNVSRLIGWTTLACLTVQ